MTPVRLAAEQFRRRSLLPRRGLLTETLASWLRDGRQPGKVVHGLREFGNVDRLLDGKASRLRRGSSNCWRDGTRTGDETWLDLVALRELNPQAFAGSGGFCSRGDRAAAATAKGSEADRDRRSDLRSGDSS